MQNKSSYLLSIVFHLIVIGLVCVQITREKEIPELFISMPLAMMPDEALPEPEPEPEPPQEEPEPEPEPEPEEEEKVSAIEQEPTPKPTLKPSSTPTQQPTNTPTQKPTNTPTQRPTIKPTDTPKPTSTPRPTNTHTPRPTNTQTPEPTKPATATPTAPPLLLPTPTPISNLVPLTQITDTQQPSESLPTNLTNSINIMGGAANTDYGSYARLLNSILYNNWRPPSVRPPVNKKYTTIVSFQINRDGSITNIKILGRSGWVLMDDSVIEGIKRANPLNQLPPAFGSDALLVSVPFIFNPN